MSIASIMVALDRGAEAILRFAKRQEADLVVMGGYGHARLRGWLFGGVPRDILRSAPLCCLMSH